MNIKQAIKCLKMDEPYPYDIFKDLTCNEIKQYTDAIIKAGLCVDTFSAYLMRLGRSNCIEDIEYLAKQK